MKFLFDVCVSVNLVQGLRSVEERPRVEIIAFEEQFSDVSLGDELWIPQLADADGQFVIVSGDDRISRGGPALAAWRESGLTAYFLTGGFAEKNRWVQLEHLAMWWRDIPPHAARVTAGSGWRMVPGSSKPQPVFKQSR